MKSELNGEHNQESVEGRTEKSYQEALVSAQALSRQWPKIREILKADPNAGDAKLEEINSMTKLPKSGIQVWFESQLKWVEETSRGDGEAKSRMMYRLKEDVERIQEKVTHLIDEQE